MMQQQTRSGKTLASASAMSTGFGGQQRPYERQRSGLGDISNSRQRHSIRTRATSQILPPRMESGVGPLESSHMHGLFASHDVFGGHAPAAESGYARWPQDRRYPAHFERNQLRNAARQRAASESLLSGHRRGYDLPPTPPGPHHGPTVTREPINTTSRARLARADSLASYWLSCGSSISSVTTRHGQQAEFCFDWQNRSQRTMTTRGSIPREHYALDPMPAPSLEEERSSPNDSHHHSFRREEDINMVTDSDDSEPQIAKTYPSRGIGQFRSTSAFVGGRRQTKDSTVQQQTVDIGGGILLKLRGAEETMQAIRNDFYTPCACSCCQQTLFCILDADYVICPTCRVVSPSIPAADDGMKHRASGDSGGVGLGFTMDQLAHYQNEISLQNR